MPTGSPQNYQGALDAIEEIVLGGNRFIKVFVDATATQQTDGNVVIVSGIKSASTADYPNVRTPATTSVAVLVGVMNTWAISPPTVLGSGGAGGTVASGITPVGAYGYAQITGYCKKVFVTASIAVEHYIKAANAAFIAIDDAAANQDGVTGLSAKSFAITKTADTGALGYTDCFLIGQRVTI